MSSPSVPREIDSTQRDLTAISMFDSLLVCGLLCIAIWALIAYTILGT
ncbi:MAG: hypothetical protein ACR2PG_09785 [Hyphomicrobiaceae bacterium]